MNTDLNTAPAEYPCQDCGVMVPTDEHCGNERADGTSDYLCCDCYAPAVLFVFRHTFSGDVVTVLTTPRLVQVGGTYESCVDIEHQGRIEKDVNVDYLERTTTIAAAV